LETMKKAPLIVDLTVPEPIPDFILDQSIPGDFNAREVAGARPPDRAFVARPSTALYLAGHASSALSVPSPDVPSDKL